MAGESEGDALKGGVGRGRFWETNYSINNGICDRAEERWRI